MDKTINKKEYVYNMLKKYGNHKRENINKLVSANDKNTVLKLAEEQKKYGLVENLYSEERNKKRAFKIYNTIKKYIGPDIGSNIGSNINLNSLLDFGGGTCDISHYLGELLKIKHVYCVDIEEWGGITWERRSDVIFKKDMTDIEDNSIDFILASYSLHHINDKELKLIIKDFDRILSENGILVIQEHDSPNENFNNLLDMQHMLYDTVISQIATYDEYIKTFYSNYKNINEWDKLLNKFKVYKLIKFPNSNDNSYICIYKKKTNTLDENILLKIQEILNNHGNAINTLGNRPINLTNKTLSIIKSNYSASIKADGLRCFLYYDTNIFSILNPFEVKEVAVSKVKKICLLDCEYIDYEDKYYIFDILIADGKDVTKLSLKERISLISKDLLGVKIKLKEIYNLDNNENIFKISKKIWEKKYKYEIDGIIYTPLYESYHNNSIYKWKPIKLQTIDFLIREFKTSNTSNTNNSKVKKYNLFVSSNNTNIKKKLKYDKKYTELFPFITEKNNYYPYYFSPSPVATIKVKMVEKNGNTYGNYNNIVIKDNTIIEFYYDKDEKEEELKWKPHKFRLDKTKGYLENYYNNTYDVNNGPNSWRTSLNIFDYIKNPIDENVLFGDEELGSDYYFNINKKGLNINLYKYNNYIKTYLYNKYIKKGDKILDLAGGRGGDLYKIKNSEGSYILHIDIVNKLLEEAKKRHNKMNNKMDIDFLKFDLLGNNVSKINKIKQNKDIEGFDLITCQFAFHYLCKSKDNIDFIINIINTNINKNGIFMMTGYDGNEIFNLLLNKSYIDYVYKNNIFAKIIKKYTDDKFKDYGQEISVFVEKIGIPQDEYLINFDYLIKKFKEVDMKVIESDNFEVKLDTFDKYLSEDEIKYIKLHKYIVFEKN